MMSIRVMSIRITSIHISNYSTDAALIATHVTVTRYTAHKYIRC